jgi:hypothetical protein
VYRPQISISSYYPSISNSLPTTNISYLLGVLNDVNEIKRENQTVAMRYLKGNSIKAKIDAHKKRIEEMRINFLVGAFAVSLLVKFI